jgi:hypothetical protein
MTDLYAAATDDENIYRDVPNKTRYRRRVVKHQASEMFFRAATSAACP